jgi:hypothetical protein
MASELSALRIGSRRHRIAARVYGTIGTSQELHAVVGELAEGLGAELRTFMMRQYSYHAALISLTLALDDPTFLGGA